MPSLNIKDYIIAGLGLMIVALIAWHYFALTGYRIQIAHLKGEVASLKGSLEARTAERDACINSNASLANKVDSQNAEIEAIKKDRDAATALYIQAREEAARRSQQHAATIDAIRKVPVPADKAQACAVAEKLVTDYIQGRQK